MRCSNASTAGDRSPAPHRIMSGSERFSSAGVPACAPVRREGWGRAADHLGWQNEYIGNQSRCRRLTRNIMPIRVRVPTPLRRFTGGNDEITAEGDSIIAVIEDLERRHPGMRERLLDDKGELRRFVNIYLNGDDIRFLNQLTSKVKDGDDISIVPAIAGGA